MSAGKWTKAGITLFAVLFMTLGVLEMEASARIGGGRSFGSRGARSFSTPSKPSTALSPTRPSVSPAQPMAASPLAARSSGMFRNLAMGMAGGFLGSMLFSGLAHGSGMGGFGGSGFGLIEILLVGGLLYFLYGYLVRRRRAESPSVAYRQAGPAPSPEPQAPHAPSFEPAADDAATGLRHIRQMDAAFDENRFTDGCMDHFFKIQAAWINRDMSRVKALLTEELFAIFHKEAEQLKKAKEINKLENIAVRSVEISEAWQEAGQDFITVRFLANLLDYRVSESGELLSGSRTEPVKFLEYWTFTRPAGGDAWRLSAIHQAG